MSVVKSRPEVDLDATRERLGRLGLVFAAEGGSLGLAQP
jgi:hypothetical protein